MGGCIFPIKSLTAGLAANLKSEMRNSVRSSSAISHSSRTPSRSKRLNNGPWTKHVSLATNRFYLSSFCNLDFTIRHTPRHGRTHYRGHLARSKDFGITFNLASVLQTSGQTRSGSRHRHGHGPAQSTFEGIMKAAKSNAYRQWFGQLTGSRKLLHRAWR